MFSFFTTLLFLNVTAKPQRTGGGHCVHIYRNWKLLFIVFPGNYVPASVENLFLAWISRMPHAEEQVDINWAHWSPWYCLAKKPSLQLRPKSNCCFSAGINWTAQQSTISVQWPAPFCTALQRRLEHQERWGGGEGIASIPVLLLCKQQKSDRCNHFLAWQLSKIPSFRLIFMKFEGFSEHGLPAFKSKTRITWATLVISSLVNFPCTAKIPAFHTQTETLKHSRNHP